MKRILLIVAALMLAAAASADQYEAPMLNMDVPSGLQQNQLYFTFEHNFLQSLRTYPSDDVFAVLDNGANLGINLRYRIIAGLEAEAGYVTANREKTVGLSYQARFEQAFLSVGASVRFFSYEDFVNSNTDQNFFYAVCLQSVPLLDEKLTVSLDAAFDGYNGTFGMAVGAGYEVIRNLVIIAEYFPVIKSGDDESFLGEYGIYVFGIRYQTFGHQFMVKFANTTAIGMRRMMLGSGTLDVYAGIEIMRLAAF